MDGDPTPNRSGTSDRQLESSEISSSPAEKPTDDAGRIRILCVDDDTVGLYLRGAILERHGFTVAVDSSPVQALRRDLLGFDLAIVDYDMPDLNGVELLFAMRAMHVAYPIILLSGNLGDVNMVQQRLFYRCLEKGKSLEALLNVIDSYVQTSKLPDLKDGASPKVRGWNLR